MWEQIGPQVGKVYLRYFIDSFFHTHYIQDRKDLGRDIIHYIMYFSEEKRIWLCFIVDFGNSSDFYTCFVPFMSYDTEYQDPNNSKQLLNLIERGDIAAYFPSPPLPHWKLHLCISMHGWSAI